MELVKYKTLQHSIPIKAIPDEKLNAILINEFIEWLSGLLSLTDETASERLEIALPAIKEHCWSMGFDEITKMFKMYADNKLNIEPIPNYFDRILFGKIVKAYKDQKPRETKQIAMPEQTQEEKDLLIFSGVVNCFDEFVQTNNIINGYTWVYDHLNEIKVIDFSADEKRNQMPIARQRLVDEAKDLDRNAYSKFMHDLENKRSEASVINMAKRMLLERFFRGLHAKGKHIKELL